MPKILIDLNNEEDQKVTDYKEKHELVSKKVALKRMIKDFKE